ncbi:serine/threonine-protein phosphatase 2A regulatory subunit B'' subunit gamma-like [Rhopalosiphum padi]|uniref:serine/threonine-protein phosphatase 2A regulatory subunit B'' subunit gamma-like n=1 Tax=Rhopalosiphum padi TaxID=40932 RepID=UPI00298E3D7F|nr:serine/threonine-protein phosphatase 2A regulatory subunit B'' subunit gamma-like [Rhopalosiphum padi]XP_060844460.1 serine/threonine-protein phosphatase 2A regulatory subunit B'' subunit gamma-like [Rhopalosiphum padi]
MDFNYENCIKEGLKNLKITSTVKNKNEEEYFKEVMQQDVTGVNILKRLSGNDLPTFYKPQVTEEANIFKAQLRAEARGRFFERELSRLLTSEELKYMWSLLQEHHIPLNNFIHNQYINYKNFIQVKQKLSDKYKSFFNPSIFLQLQDSKIKGNLSIDTFFNYIMKKIWIDQTRNGLSQYDSSGCGYLSEADFEAYILDLIPTLTQLKKLEKMFYSFYSCMVVRKFFFYLDPLRTGKIRIIDILSCGFLDELLELREENWSKESQKKNWFSVPSALHIYSSYLELDKDHNGLLSRQEITGYKSGALTSVFLDRVFQDAFTYDGEMDYKGYLNFVLATENRHEPQSLRYLFRFLDIKNQGYLDSFTINYFSRAVAERLPKEQQQMVSMEDIKDEIFDMIKPEDPAKITLKDIIRSKMGHILVNILIDFNGFWSYEFRETLANNSISDNNFNESFVTH